MKRFRKVLYIFFILYILLYIVEITMTIYQSKEIERDEFDYNKSLSLNYTKLETDDRRETRDFIWRHVDEEIPQKEKSTRILFVGDSYTWRFTYTNSNNVYWKKLQYFLELEGYNDVEIIAYCTPGLSSYDEYNFILSNDELLSEIDPDLVILQYIYNDYDVYNKNDSHYIKKYDENAFVNEYFDSTFFYVFKYLYPTLFDYISHNFANYVASKLDYNEKYGSTYGYNYWANLYLLRNFMDINKIFADYQTDFVDKLDNIKYPFVIMKTEFTDITKSQFQIDFENITWKMIENSGVETFTFREDFLNFIEEYGDKACLYNSVDDSHPSYLLAEFYAEELLNFLKDNYSDLLGEKTDIKKFELDINDSMPGQIITSRTLDNIYTIKVPMKKDMFSYYTGVGTFKLNLKYPIQINSIQLDDPYSRVWINPYRDDNNYIELENNNGTFYNNDNILVNSINIYTKKLTGSEITLIIK